MAKIKIIFFTTLILALGIAAYYSYDWISGQQKGSPQDDGGDAVVTTEEKLKDPNLLYASFFWSGMCRNKKGEDGGCYMKKYLYSDGELIEESSWTGIDNKIETEPAVRKNIGDYFVKNIKKLIRDSELMSKDCPPSFIADASWDYQVNLDGVVKSFHNPANDCRVIFNDINQIIDSIGGS